MLILPNIKNTIYKTHWNNITILSINWIWIKMWIFTNFAVFSRSKSGSCAWKFKHFKYFTFVKGFNFSAKIQINSSKVQFMNKKLVFAPVCKMRHFWTNFFPGKNGKNWQAAKLLMLEKLHKSWQRWTQFAIFQDQTTTYWI